MTGHEQHKREAAIRHGVRGEQLAAEGKIEESMAAFRQAVATDPDYADAYYNLGVLLRGLGRIDEAIESYQRAISSQPDYIEGYYNLGNAFAQQLRLDEALASYRSALSINPLHFNAMNNMANIQLTLGHQGEAKRTSQMVLAHQPDNLSANNTLGTILMAEGKQSEAIEVFNLVLAQHPELYEVLNNKGQALKGLGRLEEALGCFNSAIAQQAPLPEAHNNKGSLLMELERDDEAVECFNAALAFSPGNGKILCNKGMALQKIERYEEALTSFISAIENHPEYAEAHSNLGLLLMDQGKTREAAQSFERALEINPHYAEAQNNMGLLLISEGHLPEAIQIIEQAIKNAPSDPAAHWNYSHALLLTGRFPEGWWEYEWRMKHTQFRSVDWDYGKPRWQGENLDGRTILLYPEQGLGDVIQFSRFAAAVSEKGGRVIVKCPPPLKRLLATLGGVDQLIAEVDETVAFDVQAPLMSLPYLLGCDADTMPASVPYLSAEPDRVSHWKQRIGGQGFKIGIAWQGNPNSRIDKGRSFALKNFSNIAALDKTRLISLQKHDGVEQLMGLSADITVETLGDSFDAGTNAFVDTAGVMESLDLVITSDTAVAHLAGALGHPVWVALKFVPDWRWMLEREDTPWYPTMRLFRQADAGEWGPVFEKVRRELEKTLSMTE